MLAELLSRDAEYIRSEKGASTPDITTWGIKFIGS